MEFVLIFPEKERTAKTKKKGLALE